MGPSVTPIGVVCSAVYHLPIQEVEEEDECEGLRFWTFPSLTIPLMELFVSAVYHLQCQKKMSANFYVLFTQ